MKRYKHAKSRRLAGKALKIVKGMKDGDAVATLTVALTEAIRCEGGTREDAIATAEIAHHAVCLCLSDWFDLADHRAAAVVVPFKRKKGYFRS